MLLALYKHALGVAQTVWLNTAVSYAPCVLQNELFNLLGHEQLSGAAVLVFANKQDLKDAMRPAELSECLGLHTIKTHSYHIQSSCATTGEGLQEGLAWIAQKVHGQSK